MKKPFTLISLLLVALTGIAQSISQQKAMERVIEFLQSEPAQGSSRRAMTTTPRLESVATEFNHIYTYWLN